MHEFPLRVDDASGDPPPDLFAASGGDALLRLVADSVPALIAYYAVGSLQCRFANQRYAQYNGWTPQSILGKTVREVVGEPAWTASQRGRRSSPMCARSSAGSRSSTGASRPCPTAAPA